LIALSNAAESSCSASVSLMRVLNQDWTSDGYDYTTFDLVVVNTGACPLNLIELAFALPSGSQIYQTWNLEAMGNGIWQITNFGGVLNAGASYSSAGLILQFLSTASLTVSITNTNCSACSASQPTSAPPTSIPTPAPGVQQPASAAFVAELITAPSEVARQNLLSDEQFVFDFRNSTLGVTQSLGGKTVATSRTDFPAVIGHNIAMTVGFINACGINLPHSHPRATEINYIVSGTFQAGMFQENGARFIGNVLKAGMATVFPHGTIHFEMNLGCEPAIFVAAFNNEDPGVQTVASTFFGLPADVVQVSLNISSIQTVEDLAKFLPMNPAEAMQACMQLCGFSN